MLVSGGVRHVLPVAHPVTGHPHLDVPVALLAAGAFLAVVGAGLALPERRRSSDLGDGPATSVLPSWDGDLGRGQAILRWSVVAVLAVAMVAARTGTENELENLAPALLVGTAWPLLFLGTLAFGATWRWVDPWDTLGRAVAPGDRSAPSHDVRPAALVAIVLFWYLAAHPRPFDPRTVGAVVTVYTVIMLAGCLVRGRRSWLSSAEPVGIVLNLLARARPAAAGPDAAPPARGLHALLGVCAGGTLFAALRRTELWTDLTGATDPELSGALGLVAACAVGASLVTLQAGFTRTLAGRRWATAGHAVGLAVVPAVAGMVVAVAMARNRLTNSVQLLPGLFGDPFGRGWDVLGEPTAGLDPSPLGAAGLLAVQLGVLAVTHLWGVVVAAGLLSRRQRSAVVLLLGQLAAAGVVAISLH